MPLGIASKGKQDKSTVEDKSYCLGRFYLARSLGGVHSSYMKTTTQDVLTAMEKRESVTSAKAKKTSKWYHVCVKSFTNMHSKRVYSYAQARALCFRAKRLGLADAYVASPTTRMA
jgi:hypothetical protein